MFREDPLSETRDRRLHRPLNPRVAICATKSEVENTKSKLRCKTPPAEKRFRRYTSNLLQTPLCMENTI